MDCQRKPELTTRLLHEKRSTDREGATLPPIYQVSAFQRGTAEELEKVFQHKAPGFAYTRIGNPTTADFEKRMVSLEGGMAAVSCASGMSAIAMALLNIVSSGDEIIASSCLFAGTIDLFNDLEQLGITTRFVTDVTVEAVEPLINEKTKVLFTEVIGNPKLNVADIVALSELAHHHGIPLLVDNTSATPCLIRPLEHGADIVIHSSSKYISGSGNAISGVIIDGGRFLWTAEKFPALKNFLKFGPMAYTARLKDDLWRNFGPCAAPVNAYLASLGLETLALRMERICENALILANALRESPLYGDVFYPGLPENPYHGIAKKELSAYGGILTVRCGSKERAYAILNRLKYGVIATNIGDVRTLVIHPASTIYVSNTEQERVDAGVYHDLIRISVGIESADDLVEDFLSAAEEISREVK